MSVLSMMNQASPLTERLASLLPVLRDEAGGCLKWEEERPGGGRRAEVYRSARDYYAKQAGLRCRAADQVTSGCLVEVRTSPYDMNGALEGARTQLVFVGPLSSDDVFLRSIGWRENSVVWRGGAALLDRRLGEHWFESSQGRDENHSKYEHEIMGIASCAEAASG
ncbi:MAG: hypothetical protein INH41_30660 [Myxococcaceae bacterium]|nr:hypothetical protein [Myxococcaceae bacterium]MCA3016768.1 hypothetical protein [Myxococcaceae bacterium]